MADILIKNMEMPKACEYCPIYDDDYYQCRLEPCYDGHGRWSRDNYCPLVELPPHGRLVDATEMLKDFKNWFCKDCNNYNEIRCRSCNISDIIDYIEGSRTIVEASNGTDN